MKKLFYLAAVALVAGMASCGGEKAAEEAQDTTAAPVEEVVVEEVEEVAADSVAADSVEVVEEAAAVAE